MSSYQWLLSLLTAVIAVQSAIKIKFLQPYSVSPITIAISTNSGFGQFQSENKTPYISSEKSKRSFFGRKINLSTSIPIMCSDHYFPLLSIHRLIHWTLYDFLIYFFVITYSTIIANRGFLMFLSDCLLYNNSKQRFYNVS